MTEDPRAEIIRLMKENQEVILPNLHEMLHRNLEDFKSAGLETATVADAAFNVGVTHKLSAEGPHATIELLRKTADFFEGQFGKSN